MGVEALSGLVWGGALAGQTDASLSLDCHFLPSETHGVQWGSLGHVRPRIDGGLVSPVHLFSTQAAKSTAYGSESDGKGGDTDVEGGSRPGGAAAHDRPSPRWASVEACPMHERTCLSLAACRAALFEFPARFCLGKRDWNWKKREATAKPQAGPLRVQHANGSGW